MPAYSAPGVYAKATFEADQSTFTTGQIIPLLIGVGQEELEAYDIDMVRGSSSSIDERITQEDVTTSWVVDGTNPNHPILGLQDGSLTTFRVKNYPIVDGGGFGIITNDAKRVVATVNGSPVAVQQVQGAKGLVTLAVPTQPTDIVRVTYNMHRGDTAFTDNVSDQVTPEIATIMAPGFEPYQINAGDTIEIEVDGVSHTVNLIANPATTATALKVQVDSALIVGLTTSTFTDPDGNIHLQFHAATSLKMGNGGANGVLGIIPGQSTNRNRVFRVFNIPMTDGHGSGMATTDPSKVVVKVNNVQVIPEMVDGQNGTVTLRMPPTPGATVTIAYFANTWQDTFDFLPYALATSTIRCGYSPGRNDYIAGVDFVLENIDASNSVIHWGASRSIVTTRTTSGSTPFGTDQISALLIDDRLFLQECQPVIDSNVVPPIVSATEFLLPAIPTMGNGRDTPLTSALYADVVNGRQGLTTNRPDLVIAYAGRTLQDALTRNPVKVMLVEGSERKITLKAPVPPDYKVFATFWTSRLADNQVLLTCKTPGPINLGTYEMLSTLTGKNLFQVLWGSKIMPETVQWPRGSEFIPDAYHTGAGTPVNETVTVTFGTENAATANFTSRGAEPYYFVSGQSDTWITDVSGSVLTTNLSNQAQAFLVGEHVDFSAGTINIPSAPNNMFNLVIEDVVFNVAITPGPQTHTNIENDINAVISSHGTATAVAVGGTDVVFVIQSNSVPVALPDGFDHLSYVQIQQGNIEGLLGFKAFQRADGTPRATNKPATLLSRNAGPYNITAGLNDTLELRVDGVDYSVTLTPGIGVATITLVTDINNTVLNPVASVGTLNNTDKLRLMSLIDSAASNITIVGGTALQVLGFTQGESAQRSLVTAQEVADALMVNMMWASIAKPIKIHGKTYLNIETAGASSTEYIAFQPCSALNSMSGTGITPGVDGDVGDDVKDNFVVTSTHPNGSTGTGYPGQTFTAENTGLRFTVLPSSTGSYTSGGTFTLLVSQTFRVHPSIPTYAAGGLELIVSNTVGVGVEDIATVSTFNPSGVEPQNGDFYYLSYRYQKQDFTEKFIRQLKLLELNYGPISPENALTLGANLAIQNGAPVVACKQVKKAPNSSQATNQAFVTALQESAILVGNIRPDRISCLTSATAVAAALTQHCEIMSNFRNQSERTGFIGFASGTTPSSAQTVARGLLSNRMMAVYPDTAVITITNELGEDFQTVVSGIFIAACVLGSSANPSFDVATPYTRRRLVGLDRLIRILQPQEADQTATAGITVIEDLNPILRIRQGLTTNMTNVLTRLPTVTQITDYHLQGLRVTLDGFIGGKNVASKTTDIETAVTNFSKDEVLAEILSAFAGVSAFSEINNLEAVRVQEYIAPIFPLNYIFVDVGVRSRVLVQPLGTPIMDKEKYEEVTTCEYVVFLLALDTYLRYLNDIGVDPAQDTHMMAGVRIFRMMDRAQLPTVVKHLTSMLPTTGQQKMVLNSVRPPLDRDGLAKRALKFRTAIDRGGTNTVSALFKDGTIKNSVRRAMAASVNTDADAALDVFKKIKVVHSKVRNWIKTAADIAQPYLTGTNPISVAADVVTEAKGATTEAQIAADAADPSSIEVLEAKDATEILIEDVQIVATEKARQAMEDAGEEDLPPTKSEVIGMMAAMQAAAKAKSEEDFPPAVRRLSDPEQRNVAMSTGRVVVQAGAGSGKTTSVVALLQRLVEDDKVSPSNIFVGVFNVKAAQTIEERSRKLMGDEATKALNLGTIHAKFRKAIVDFGTPEYREAFQKRLIAPPKGRGRPFITTGQFAGTMVKLWKMCFPDDPLPRGAETQTEKWKFNDISPEQAYREALDDNERALAKWYEWTLGFKGQLGVNWKPPCASDKPPVSKTRDGKFYDKEDKANAAWWNFKLQYRTEKGPIGEKLLVDFSDMIVKFRDTLRDNPKARKAIQQQYSHIIFDEAQDLSKVAHEIADLMSEHIAVNDKEKLLMFIGDTNQAINSFVGGSPQHMADRYESGFQLKTIKTNHRCLPEIVETANTLMSNHKKTIPFEAAPDPAKPRGQASIQVMEAPEQAVAAQTSTQRWIDEVNGSNGEIDFSRYAVLSRTRKELDTYELACIVNGVPYSRKGGGSFLQTPEMRATVGYMNLVTSSDNGVLAKSLAATLNTPNRWLSGDLTVLVPNAIERLASRRRVSTDQINPLDLIQTDDGRTILLQVLGIPGWKTASALDQLTEMSYWVGTHRRKVRESAEAVANGEPPTFTTSQLIEGVLGVPGAPDGDREVTLREVLVPDFKKLSDEETSESGEVLDPESAALGSVYFLKILATENGAMERMNKDPTDPSQFLEYIRDLDQKGKDLRVDQDEWDAQQEELFKDNPEKRKKANAVTLSTIHSIKGAEWPDTTVVMTKGKFPYEPRPSKAEESFTPEQQERLAKRREEEFLTERQLAYVAMTRASEKLTIVSQTRDGKGRPLFPSPFIAEAGLSVGENVAGQPEPDETMTKTASALDFYPYYEERTTWPLPF